MNRRLGARTGVITAMLAAMALAVSALGTTAPGVGQQADATAGKRDWKLAVVFRRDGERKRCLGTVTNPSLPAVAAAAARGPGRAARAAASQPAADYEIWLAANGATRGLWYSSAWGVWGEVLADGTRGPGRPDDGALRRLVDAAGPPRAAGPLHADCVASATFAPSPPTLEVLCRSAHTIAVGRVVGILRQAHTPYNSTDRLQHTVYVFAVEQYLKTDDLGPRPLLKVWQDGGPLPWVSADGMSRGVGFVIEGDPMLNVGDRYLLFLKRSGAPFHAYDSLGYVPGNAGGFHGPIRELDEYVPVDYWRSKVLLQGGITRSPAVSGYPMEDHWRFREGPQILDTAEAAALEMIRQVLAGLQGG